MSTVPKKETPAAPPLPPTIERRSQRKRRKTSRFKVPPEGLSCSMFLGDGKSTSVAIVDVTSRGCRFLAQDAVKGEAVDLLLSSGDASWRGGCKVLTVEETHGPKFHYSVRFESELPPALIDKLGLMSVPDRRAPQDLYAEAKKFFRRVQEWQTDEYYHYHRNDTAFENAKKVDFTSNDYLNLSAEPRVLDAAKSAIAEWGLGTAGPSIFAANLPLHDQLSNMIADLKKMESCMLCPSGFTANSGVFTGLIKQNGTIIFLDEKDHASIYHGAMASGGKIKMFRHNDMADLERKLDAYEYSAAKVICVDGVFSMDGDLAPLDVIHGLAKKYNASLWIDDAHSFGIFGRNGAGIEDHFGILGKADIVTGSLSKTLGAFGGFVCASKAVNKFLDHLGREFVYTTTLPATICAGAIEGIKMFSQEGDSRRQKLWENTRRFIDGLKKLNLPIGDTDSPIIPVIFGHETVTQRFARELYCRGVFVNSVTRPAVRRDAARIRLSVRCEHSFEQIDYALEQFRQVADLLGVRR